MSSKRFEICHAVTSRWEGGWSDNPKDRGGKTNWGITQATLSAYLGRPATAAEIRALTHERAKTIYAANYWDTVGGDVLPAGVDLCVYDFGVNSGPSRAVKSLQAALGVKADGWVGEKTVEALGRANPVTLINALCDRRMAFLKGLGAEQWAEFGKGWSNRVLDVRKQAIRMANGAKPTPPVAPVSDEGTAKALPAPPVEPKVTTEQKVGGAVGTVAVVAGPAAAFWRDNRDLLSDPIFLGVLALLAAVTIYLLLRKPKTVESEA